MRMLATGSQPEPAAKATYTKTTFLIRVAMTILLCSKDPLGPFDLESFANCPNVISATNSAILAARRPIPARDAARQSCSGASGKVATTTYASAVSRFRLLLQARSNSPHKREISMAKVSGVIPHHARPASLGSKGANPRRTARLLTPTDLGRQAGDELAAALTN